MSLQATIRRSLIASSLALAGLVALLANLVLSASDLRQERAIADRWHDHTLEVLDIALRVEPEDAQALAINKAALEKLLAGSGGTNLSETMWLKSEIAAIDQRLAPPDLPATS